jgi:hypothetical protein
VTQHTNYAANYCIHQPAHHRLGPGSSPKVGASCVPGMKSRFTPACVIVTVRTQPPEDASRAMACVSALTTNARASSSVKSSRQYLSHQPAEDNNRQQAQCYNKAMAVQDPATWTICLQCEWPCMSTRTCTNDTGVCCSLLHASASQLQAAEQAPLH